MKFLRILLLACLLLTGAWNTALAAKNEEKGKLESLQTSLVQEKEHREQLARSAATLKKDLDGTRADMTALGEKIQKNEKSLQNLEEQIKDLSTQKAVIDQRMEKDRAASARLLLALTRLKRTPPEAMIARPESPVQTARSALVMKEIVAGIQEKSAALRADLEKLSALTSDLDEQKTMALAEGDRLKAQKTDMDALIQKRESLYAQTMDDVLTSEAAIKKISAQAKDIQDLMSRLKQEEERTARLAAPKEQKKDAPPEKVARSVPPRPGAPRLPVPGNIAVAFGEPDSFGAPSKGWRIEGRAGALVVAPMGGSVRFAGPFKNYGNMIIIEHRGDYHSLIAGLEKIDTVVGREVGAGEPLGTLKARGNGENSVLYYELRHKGESIDPALKFGDMS